MSESMAAHRSAQPQSAVPARWSRLLSPTRPLCVCRPLEAPPARSSSTPASRAWAARGWPPHRRDLPRRPRKGHAGSAPRAGRRGSKSASIPAIPCSLASAANTRAGACRKRNSSRWRRVRAALRAPKEDLLRELGYTDDADDAIFVLEVDQGAAGSAHCPDRGDLRRVARPSRLHPHADHEPGRHRADRCALARSRAAQGARIEIPAGADRRRFRRRRRCRRPAPISSRRWAAPTTRSSTAARCALRPGPEKDAEALADALPASASRDYGRPFAEIFAASGGDFYKIDPAAVQPGPRRGDGARERALLPPRPHRRGAARALLRPAVTRVVLFADEPDWHSRRLLGAFRRRCAIIRWYPLRRLRLSARRGRHRGRRYPASRRRAARCRLVRNIPNGSFEQVTFRLSVCCTRCASSASP